MKNVTYITLVILCVLCFQSKAQNYFNNRYDATGNFDGTNSVDTFQGKYLSIGIEGVYGSNWGLSCYLLNQDGTVFKKKAYGFQGDNLLPNNGKYIRMGSQFYSCGVWAYGGYKSKAFLWRFNTNLDSVKFTSYGFINQTNVVTSFVKHSDKKIYMVGYVDDTLQTNSDILLIKTDTAGNEIWKKKIGIAGMDETGYCIKSSQDGSLIICGNKNPTNDYTNAGAYILKTDTSGAVLWQQWFPTNYGTPANSLEELPNGDILVISGKGYGFNSTTSQPYSRFQVIKLTTTGSLLFNKSYGNTEIATTFYSSMINKKNNLVAVGQKAYANSSVTGVVYEINTIGDSLFSKEYYNEQGSQNYFRDVLQADDKGYCFAGFIIPVPANGGTGTEDIWLLKVDSNFCESATPCGYGVGINELDMELNWRVYPNPVNESLTLVWVEGEGIEPNTMVTITNSLGEIVLSLPLVTELSRNIGEDRRSCALNTNNLPSGLYYLSIKTKDKTMTRKIMIQK